MRIARLAIALALGVLPVSPVSATPARVNALDGGTFLVPDDWDVLNYYSLIPEFTNHLYFYYPLDRRPYGWGMYDAGAAGSFIVWINRTAGTAPIFGAAQNLSSLGFTNRDLDAAVSGVADWDPKDDRIAVPDVRLSVGWGRRFGESLNAGLCVQWAGADETETGAATGTGALLGTLSDAGFVGTYSLFSASVTGYEQRQRSASFVVGPSVSIKGEGYSVDMYGAYIALGVDNLWTVTLLPDAGTGFDRGSVTRTLAFDGGASWQTRGRVMVPLTEDTTLAVNGSFTSLDLSTTRRITGSFAGTGLSALQSAGIDHTAATETLTAAPWSGVAGLVTRTRDYVVVIGLGVNGSSIEVVDASRTPRAGGVTLDDTVEAATAATTIDNMNVPMILGVEYAMTRWLRLRAVGQRNIIGMTTVETTTSTDANADGVKDRTETTTTETSGIRDWVFRLGFGLANERIGWDVLFNLAPADPAYSSPFFSAPRTATLTHPSVTTAIVYKW